MCTKNRKVSLINLCDDKNCSPLFVACHNGHVKTVKLLLENGADINVCNTDGESPLLIACLNGHVEIAVLLFDHFEQTLFQSKRPDPKICS